MSNFAKKIKCLREQRSQTQDQIAKLLSISKATVSKYESGEREPDIETIKILAKHFNVSVDYILGLTDQAAHDHHSFIREKTVPPYGEPSYRRDSFLQDGALIRLAAKIKHHNLDIGAIEKIIDNVLMLKKGNQKHP